MSNTTPSISGYPARTLEFAIYPAAESAPHVGRQVRAAPGRRAGPPRGPAQYAHRVSHDAAHAADLRRAAYRGDATAVAHLLRLGADPHAVDRRRLDRRTDDLISTARRVRTLYSVDEESPGRAGRTTRLDRMVQRYELDDARAVLESFGPDAESVWFLGAAAGREDILRAALAVLPEESIQRLARTPADTRYRFVTNVAEGAITDVLHAAMQRHGYSDALRRYLNAFPHLPAVAAQLNNGAQGFLCRHWVTAWLDQAAARPADAEVDYTAFQSPEHMRAVSSLEDLHAGNQGLHFGAAETHMVDHGSFGPFVAGRLAALASGESVAMMITSTRHAMAMELRRLDEGGVPTYHARFYDPAMTTVHASATTRDLSVAAAWNPPAFLAAEPVEQDYYGGQDGISMIYVVPARGVPRELRPPGPDRRIAGCLVADPLGSPTAVWHLMTDGFLGDLAALPDRVAGMPDEQALAVLGARPGGAATAIIHCLYTGTLGVVPFYAEAVKRTSPEVRRALLNSCVTQVRQLCASGQHPAIVRNFHTLLKALGLSGTDIGNVLAERDRREAPPLHWVLAQGHLEGLAAFGDVLLAEPMPRQLLLANLQASRAGTGAGLAQALANGHADAIRLFGRIVGASSLPPADRMTLMAAVEQQGDALRYGLLRAFENNRADAIRAYGEALSSTLAPEDAAMVLSAVMTMRGADGRAALARLWGAPHLNEAREALQSVLQRTEFGEDDLSRIRTAWGMDRPPRQRGPS